MNNKDETITEQPKVSSQENDPESISDQNVSVIEGYRINHKGLNSTGMSITPTKERRDTTGQEIEMKLPYEEGNLVLNMVNS